MAQVEVPNLLLLYQAQDSKAERWPAAGVDRVDLRKVLIED